MKTVFNFKVLCTAHSLALMLASLTGLCWQATVLADVVVITHSSAAIGSIDAGTLKSIYLGKLKSWPDGSALMVADQDAGSKVRKTFIVEVVGKKEKKYDAYWAKKAFSGKGVQHRSLANDEAVKLWVVKHKGSIGYIDSSSVDSTVKVLFTVK